MPKRKAHSAGRAEKATTKSTTIYFYLPDEQPYGILCQWHPSPIILPTASLHFLVTQSTAKPPPSAILSTYAPSITFTCAEQLYMFSKALFFSDEKSCSRILSLSDPKEQKKVGQRVAGFNDYKWMRVKSRVVRVGNWYKFWQNGGMREVFMGTGERELVEASTRDRVWGVGFNARNAEENREIWGENRLGKALESVRMRMRETLEKEEGGEAVDWEWDGGLEVDEDESLEMGVNDS
jgi:ribA/ribD-fused uncharacterized protein